ncbi:MAG: hypothetical protein WCA49_14625 [Candidatus Sulfotelmatobacter sp.]
MPTREELLAKRTHKQEGVSVGRRVFYTLTGESGNPHGDKLQADLTSKAIALLFEVLCGKGYITEKQLDEILLDLVS